MKERILKIKEQSSLYSIALDIGISESTLYNYINDYRKISKTSINKIREYLKRRENNENRG